MFRRARTRILFAGIATIAIALCASSSFAVGVSTAAAQDATALSACKAISKLADQIAKRGATSKKVLKSYARARKKLSASGTAGASDIALLLKTAKGATARVSAVANAAAWCGPILASGGAATTTLPPSTSAPARKAKREYPAHGPSDPMFPTDKSPADNAYDDLRGNCATLLDLAQNEWDRSDAIKDAQGKDTIPLYESAAFACLGRWGEAINTFDAIPRNPDFTGTQGNPCPRLLVLEWLSGLIEERKKDPSFSPVFVESSKPDVTCEPEAPSTSDEPTGTTTTPTTSTTPSR